MAPPIAAQVHQIGFITDRAGAIVGDVEASLPMRACWRGSTPAFIGPGGLTLELDTTNFCTAFVLDRRHLVTAGHCFPSKLRRDGGAPIDYVVVLGPVSPVVFDARLRVERSHFIEGAELELVAWAHDGEDRPDWALLRTSRDLPRGATPLHDVASTNDALQAVGFPGYRPLHCVSAGCVKAVEASGVLHVHYEACHGQSGSPVFDGYGNVVGVHGGTNRLREHATVTPIREFLPALLESRARCR